MRISRSKRLVFVLGAVCVVTAGAWFLMAVTKVEEPLRPWQSPSATAARSASGVAQPVPNAVEKAEPLENPVPSSAVAAIPSVPTPTPVPSQPAPLSSETVASEGESAAPTAEPAVQPASVPTALAQQQIEGTHRMYLAHQSLRSPEVADPDSKSNTAILSTMVRKALIHSPAGPA